MYTKVQSTESKKSCSEDITKKSYIWPAVIHSSVTEALAVFMGEAWVCSPALGGSDRVAFFFIPLLQFDYVNLN